MGLGLRADERRQLASGGSVYDKLSECGSAPADAPEPWMIKSKVATLMAQVVRQEGASMWTGLMSELAAGAGAGSPSRRARRVGHAIRRGGRRRV